MKALKEYSRTALESGLRESHISFSRRAVSTLLVLAAILVSLMCLGSFAEWVVTLGVFLLFSFAFLPLTQRILCPNPISLELPLFYGMASSLVLSCAFSSLFIYMFGFHIGALSILLLIIGISLLWVYRLPGSSLFDKRGTTNESNDNITKIFLILVLISIIVPLLGIGRLTPKGLAYSSLFGYDFLNRVSYTIAVANGIPIENPFFSGRPLPYHIFAYSLPAVVYNILGASGNIQHVLRIFSVLLTILLVGCLFGTLRIYGFSTRTRVCLGILAFFAYSYNGLAVLLRDGIRQNTSVFSEFLNGQGLLNFSSASHGLFRTLMIEPHSVMVLCIGFILFALRRIGEDQGGSRMRYMLSSILVAAAVGTEVFLGGILAVWFGITMLHKSITNKGRIRRETLVGLLVLGLSLILAFALYEKMGIVNLGASGDSLVLRPSLAYILSSPALFPVELGPTLFFAGYLLIKVFFTRETRINDRFDLISLAVIGVACIFFVHHATEDVLVLRKSVMLIQIPLLLLSGILFEQYFNKRCFRWGAMVPSGILIVLSLQTFLWDFHTFTAWNNPNLSAYVSIEDYRASRWIIRNTPRDSIIQAWISYASETTGGEAPAYSLIPELAERKTAVGIWEIALYSQTEDDTPASRWKEIRDVLFRGNNASAAWEVAQRYSIDYIYIGAYEKREAPDGYSKFESSPDKFETVFSQDGVNIYRIL